MEKLKDYVFLVIERYGKTQWQIGGVFHFKVDADAFLKESFLSGKVEKWYIN